MRYYYVLLIGLIVSPQLICVATDEIAPQYPFKYSRMVVCDLTDIRNAKRINTPIEAVPRNANKTPTDVYIQTHVLLEKLKKLSEKPGYTIETAVTLPEKKSGRMVPADVLELLRLALKITTEMRQTAGLSRPAINVPLQPEKTPPDVYRQVVKSIALVNTLL